MAHIGRRKAPLLSDAEASRTDSSAPWVAGLLLGVGGLTDVGAYALSESPFGTFDQGGNVREWIESHGPPVGEERILRGGDWDGAPGNLASSVYAMADPMFSFDFVGFRVASRLPEPGAAALGTTSLAVLAGLAQRRRRTR